MLEALGDGGDDDDGDYGDGNSGIATRGDTFENYARFKDKYGTSLEKCDRLHVYYVGDGVDLEDGLQIEISPEDCAAESAWLQRCASGWWFHAYSVDVCDWRVANAGHGDGCGSMGVGC